MTHYETEKNFNYFDARRERHEYARHNYQTNGYMPYSNAWLSRKYLEKI